MAKICCKVLSESETTTPCEPSSRSARRRRMEMRRSKFGCAGSESSGEKRQKLDVSPVSRDCDNAVESSKAADGGELVLRTESDGSKAKGIVISDHQATLVIHPLLTALIGQDFTPKFGAASTCGRRRDMEDAVAIHPFFCRSDHESVSELHYFGVYDGHGCSHVAMKCRDRLHELVKEEIEKVEARTEWKNAMEKSFGRMDKEVIVWNGSEMASNCRCELQTPEYDVVGSTAVVAIVTPDKVIVANCGDSRAVLCRNGKAVPLSVDHKPDRPDELSRIQAAGGRVLFWDCPRVLGVLAMSRAIGDNYLKQFVSCEPEVTVTDRTAEDDCLILASDGLWDVVSNDTACGVARMCLRGKALAGDSTSNSCLSDGGSTGENADKACLDASMLLTKLALARRSSDNVSVVVIDLKRNV